MTSPERVRLLLAAGGRGAFGTPERACWELATRLPEARYDVTVWLPPGAEIDELADALQQRGRAVERPGEPRSRWDLRGLAAVGAMVRRARPALLHLHTEAEGGHRALPSLTRLFGIERWVATHHGLPGWEPWPALASADAVTAVCESAAEALIRAHGVPRARVRVVPNGVEPPDPEEMRGAREVRQSLGASAQRPLWVCAARLEDVKGHETLLQALQRVRQRGLDFVLALAGEGARRAGLERMARELGVDSQVRFLGSVEALGPVLWAADLVVLASREEGQPLSILEAMARGRPVVASAVGGLPDLIEDGVSGVLVPVGDVDALSRALALLHERPDAARRLGDEAAERAQARFTWAHAVERHEAVYDDVLGLAGFTPEPDSRSRSATPVGPRG